MLGLRCHSFCPSWSWKLAAFTLARFHTMEMLDWFWFSRSSRLGKFYCISKNTWRWSVPLDLPFRSPPELLANILCVRFSRVSANFRPLAPVPALVTLDGDERPMFWIPDGRGCCRRIVFFPFFWIRASFLIVAALTLSSHALRNQSWGWQNQRQAGAPVEIGCSAQ